MTEMQRVRKLLSRLCTSRLFPVALLGVTCVIALVWGFLELKPVRVYDGVTDTTVYTSSAQPNIILGKAGILPGENDLVDTRHNADGKLEITYIRDGAFDLSSLTQSSAVSVSYYGTLAQYTQEAAAPETVTVEIESAIPYGTVTQETSLLNAGEIRVKSAGVAGVSVARYEQTMVNGKIVKSVKLGEEVVSEPVDEVVQLGTYVARNPSLVSQLTGSGGAVMTSADVPCFSLLTPSSPIPLDANGYPVNYSRVITGPGTAYTAAPGKGTASGRLAMQGHVAVDPREIPYGTELYIVSADGKFVYGYCIAADTGGFVHSTNIVTDLYFSNMSDIYRFGKRDVLIFVLN